MSFDWKEYLDIARFLAKGDFTEFSRDAALRCAVSRAYYSAFCHARNYARNKGDFIPKGKPEDHGELKIYYNSMRMHKIARGLTNLRLWRNDCDYEDQVGNLERLFKSAFSKAEYILNTLH